MALTEIYVDPAIAANSGTGTIGDAYGDLQYALNTMTRDATNGDRLNIKAGTAEVMASAITLATYGTPTAAAPLVFQGYTSAAGDGGIGEIDNGGANVGVYTAGASFVHWVDMKLGDTGTAQILNINTYCLLINCEFHSSSQFSSVQVGTGSQVHRCKFASTLGTNSLRCSSSETISHCYFTRSSGNCIYAGSGVKIINNIFDLSGSATARSVGTGGVFSFNSVRGGGGTGTGFVGTSDTNVSVVNNIFTGFSGAGAEAILISGTVFLVLGANAFYNNTTNVNGTIVAIYQPANITLTSDPFTDASGGDFSIAAAAKAELQAQGWPSDFNGINTSQFLDPGAAQIEIDVASGAHRIFGGLITG